MSYQRSGARATILIGVLALLLAACGQVEGGASMTTRPAATTGATTTMTSPTTTTTSPTTTTTLSSGEVLTRFIEIITDPDFEAVADVALDIQVGDFAVSGTGRMEVDGPDSYTLYVFEAIDTVEMIQIGGITYERTGDGPWLSDEGKVDPFAGASAPDQITTDLELVAWLKTLGSLEHLGVVESSGTTLHRIGLPPNTDLDPVALGYPPDAQVTVEATFWAADNGTPHAIDLETIDLTDPDLPVEFVLRIEFVPSEAPVVVTRPAGYWMRHESSELGYSIGHPHDWDPFEERGELVYDSFIAPLGEQLDVYRVDLDLEGQVPLNAWLAEFRALAVNDWGYEAAPPTEVEVAGLPGRQMPFSGEDESGSVYGIYAVSQVSPSVVFEFVLWGLPDEKGNARELMDGFLATFVPSGS